MLENWLQICYILASVTSTIEWMHCITIRLRRMFCYSDHGGVRNRSYNTSCLCQLGSAVQCNAQGALCTCPYRINKCQWPSNITSDLWEWTLINDMVTHFFFERVSFLCCNLVTFCLFAACLFRIDWYKLRSFLFMDALFIAILSASRSWPTSLVFVFLLAGSSSSSDSSSAFLFCSHDIINCQFYARKCKVTSLQSLSTLKLRVVIWIL